MPSPSSSVPSHPSRSAGSFECSKIGVTAADESCSSRFVADTVRAFLPWPLSNSGFDFFFHLFNSPKYLLLSLHKDWCTQCRLATSPMTSLCHSRRRRVPLDLRRFVPGGSPLATNSVMLGRNLESRSDANSSEISVAFTCSCWHRSTAHLPKM